MPPDPSEFENEPSYTHTLTLHNQGTEDRVVTVRVTHLESGETVYSESVGIEGGGEVEIFHFSELTDRYSGVEVFEIQAEADDQTDSTEFATNSCNAFPFVSIDEANLTVSHAVC